MLMSLKGKEYHNSASLYSKIAGPGGIIDDKKSIFISIPCSKKLYPFCGSVEVSPFYTASLQLITMAAFSQLDKTIGFVFNPFH